MRRQQYRFRPSPSSASLAARASSQRPRTGEITVSLDCLPLRVTRLEELEVLGPPVTDDLAAASENASTQKLAIAQAYQLPRPRTEERGTETDHEKHLTGMIMLR